MSVRGSRGPTGLHGPEQNASKRILHLSALKGRPTPWEDVGSGAARVRCAGFRPVAGTVLEGEGKAMRDEVRAGIHGYATRRREYAMVRVIPGAGGAAKPNERLPAKGTL